MIDFNKLFNIEVKEIKEKSIIRYPGVLDLCSYPYPRHKKGCPNVEKCRAINVPYFDKLLKYLKFTRFYLIYSEFNFKSYKELRTIENPEFFNTENRLKCVLYWQGALKKIIKDFIKDTWENNKKFYVLGCGIGLKLFFQSRVASMEAVGINVLSTMKLNGIKFEVKPVNKVVLCNLLCSKKKVEFIKKLN